MAVVNNKWSQQQREVSLAKKLAKEQGKVTTGWVNPNSGKYYEPCETKTATSIALEMQAHADRLRYEEMKRMAEEEHYDQARRMSEVAKLYATEAYSIPVYMDAEGRIFHTKHEEAPAEHEPPPVVHKAGHFPTQWMEEAIDKAEDSVMCVTLTVERNGVMVTAQEAGEKYASHVITWTAMEHAKVNPLILAIEDVERKLELLQKIKAKVA